MAQVGELMDTGENMAAIKSPIGSTDEFFDAVDDVTTVAAKDDDDFLKKIEIAISEENPPPAKRLKTDELAENGDKIEVDLVESVTDVASAGDLVNGNALPTAENEDDLLKDLDDDQEEDLEAVSKEVEDLLESVLEDEVKEIENSEENSENPPKEPENIDEELENKLLEDDEIVNDTEVDNSAAIEATNSEVITQDDKIDDDELSKVMDGIEGTISETDETVNETVENEEKSDKLEESEEGNLKNLEANLEIQEDKMETSEDKMETSEDKPETSEDKPETSEELKATEDNLKTSDDNLITSDSNLENSEDNLKTSDNDQKTLETAIDDTEKLTGQSSDEVPSVANDESATKIPEITRSDSSKSPEEDEDLLEACESPKETQNQEPEVEENQQDDVSVASSTPDETPEESSDEKLQTGVNEDEKADSNLKTDDKMEVDESETTESTPEVETEIESAEKKEEEQEKQCVVMETDPTPEPEKPKETIPIKFQFMRKFSTAVGKLSRPELEEMLVQKITESLMFCSENTELRTRLEKQEKLCETFKKRLDNVVKQYNDLQMIHTRVMKDLNDRPDAPITPVKITRAVGLQVYQPVARTKNAVPSSPMFNIQANKRPIEEPPHVNGKSQENLKKKKKIITPLRPPLSATERASLDAIEARAEQTLRTTVSKSMTPTPNVTLSAVTNGAPKKAAPSQLASQQSIDLTDDLDEDSSAPVARVGQQTPQPPALVAIRANQAHQAQRNAYVVKSPMIVPANSAAGRLVQYRPSQPDVNRVHPSPRHPAALPIAPTQISKPGMKKIPPKPAIKINNVANGIIVSWTVEMLSPTEHAEITSYQIYAYEETSMPPTTDNWRHVGDVKALLLPMAVTLTQFQEGQKYWFAVRAVDCHKRLSAFSTPRTWNDK